MKGAGVIATAESAARLAGYSYIRSRPVRNQESSSGPDGNVQHCSDHGITKEEVEEVLENATDAEPAAPPAGPLSLATCRWDVT